MDFFCTCWVTVVFHPASGNVYFHHSKQHWWVPRLSWALEHNLGLCFLPFASCPTRPEASGYTSPGGAQCWALWMWMQSSFRGYTAGVCSQQWVCAGRGRFVFHLVIEEKEKEGVGLCHPVRPKGQDPPVVPSIVKAPQTQLRPPWQNGQTASRCLGCGISHPAAPGWTGSLIPLALHFPGVRKYSDWTHFNISLCSWCNWSLFLNRWHFHSHLSQHKSGVNLGKVTWLYWSLWKCRRSQSGLVLTENTALGEQNHALETEISWPIFWHGLFLWLSHALVQLGQSLLRVYMRLWMSCNPPHTLLPKSSFVCTHLYPSLWS